MLTVNDDYDSVVMAVKMKFLYKGAGRGQYR